MFSLIAQITCTAGGSVADVLSVKLVNRERLVVEEVVLAPYVWASLELSLVRVVGVWKSRVRRSGKELLNEP